MIFWTDGMISLTCGWMDQRYVESLNNIFVAFTLVQVALLTDSHCVFYLRYYPLSQYIPRHAFDLGVHVHPQQAPARSFQLSIFVKYVVQSNVVKTVLSSYDLCSPNSY